MKNQIVMFSLGFMASFAGQALAQECCGDLPTRVAQLERKVKGMQHCITELYSRTNSLQDQLTPKCKS